LRKAEVGFDDFKGKGVAILDFGKPIPSIAVSLDTDAIDLNPYLAPKPAAESQPAEGASAWDAAPLGFEALRGADIKVQLATKKLVYGAVEMAPATIEAALTDGRLNTGIADAGLYGGKADAQIVLDGSGETPEMEVTFTARGVSARDFLRDFAGLDRIEGEASLTAVLKSRGNSQQEMISTLRGPAAISVNKGAIRGLDASAVAAAAVEAPLAGWPLRESNVTEFDSLSAEFAIDDGIAARQIRSTATVLASPAGAKSICCGAISIWLSPSSSARPKSNPSISASPDPGTGRKSPRPRRRRRQMEAASPRSSGKSARPPTKSPPASRCNR
jgi:AsmA protein